VVIFLLLKNTKKGTDIFKVEEAPQLASRIMDFYSISL